MPIIGNVGRKSFRVRALNLTIHLVLILGGLTMLYPFMIMVSGSMKSNVDSKNFSVWPRYFSEDEMLFKKYVEARYNETSTDMLVNYGMKFMSFENVNVPERVSRQRWDDWHTFLEEHGDEHGVFDYRLAENFARGVAPKNRRKFCEIVKEEVGESLDAYSSKYDDSIDSWELVRVEEQDNLSRRFTGAYEGILERFASFRDNQNLAERYYSSLDGYFVNNELLPEYKSDISILNERLGTKYPSWTAIRLSRTMPSGPLKEHWVRFVKDILNVQHITANDSALQAYQDMLSERYDNQISVVNEQYNTSYKNFREIQIPKTLPPLSTITSDWSTFIEKYADPATLVIKSVEFDYRDWLKEKYKGDIKALEKAHQVGYPDFESVRLTHDSPGLNVLMRKDWLDFVRNRADESSIGLLATSQSAFIAFAKQKFPTADDHVNLAEFNKAYGTNYAEERNIYPSLTLPKTEQYKKDWLEFVREFAGHTFLTVNVEKEAKNWKGYLQEKYGNIEELNNAYLMNYGSFDMVAVDNHNADYFIFQENKSEIFWEFVKRNYIVVLDLMLYSGRAVVNTVIYCALSIIAALLINPIAAYAMSRFKLPTTYKIILILMLTMAFPPMVMGIPNFLMLKRMGLLNTFWALILPAAANGYFIFLLKGFFDSLPHELFECATIDGASEWMIFWNIAMALSKPIMAVIALNAFNLAYRNFMMAFILCQDRNMWTLMVHIYQLMIRSSQGVGFAALVIASIPVFVVFIFCQNIIIRGIVVPTEK